MRYVILRDDDTNAFTPVECLERLYRPFLNRELPVNLAVIPRVRTDALRADGMPEEFLFGKKRPSGAVPLGDNSLLVGYLHENPGFCVVQHGFNHSMNEFSSNSRSDVRHKIRLGAEIFAAAGFNNIDTFVAPYDNYSAISLKEIARRFTVFSTGWFNLRRLPASWWVGYALMKMFRRQHWRVGGSWLLSHRGCLLSRYRPSDSILGEVQNLVFSQRLTVLVTHWWEYFRDGVPDERFVSALHETGAWLAQEPCVSVISFDDIARGNVRLN